MFGNDCENKMMRKSRKDRQK